MTAATTSTLALPDTGRTFLAGRWSRDHREVVEVRAPAGDVLLATVPRQGPVEVDAAVHAALASRDAWAATDPGARAAALDTLADALAGEVDDLAALISADVGTPAKVARAVQVELPITVLRTTAARLRTMTFTERRGPSEVTHAGVGVVGAITPWNYPLHQSVAKIAGAWAAGCPVVHKPSELAPLAVLRLGELIAEVVVDLELPAGVYSQLSGVGHEVGALLAGHPDLDHLSFTGSAAVGAQVAAAAATQLTAVTLELGGKSPAVVLPGGNLEAAVRATVNSCLLNSGQTCNALTRLLVHRSVYEEAARLAGERAASLESRLGPLISAAHRDRVNATLERALDEGARLVVGGPDAPTDRGAGFWARATVLTDLAPDAGIVRDEVFGPVLCVQAYDDEEEALRLASAAPYGLAAAIWARDGDEAVRFARRLRVGQVSVNGAPFDPEAPFGGFGASGFGRELGEAGIRNFLTTTSVQLPSTA
ncbi:aldehyde dehydrogenase family protein [Microlunatus antarcticus]|uniref:aldehyde dehydrogenase (NAD(+)) n=1 Tax=Microlunatus antarcticus TaxID=53388 RepID=A0A7W5JZG1_9ACTN|nr:aldehyde dehydrogenase family protein [Microlunatus antarcticus]MBB3329144.1 acyl-CoA reductase-like NAD-dependent aldehyde dehydrogenase [Microlunatus antarcticus]